MKSVGLDLHKVNSQVCELDEGGQVGREVRIATCRKQFAKLFGGRERMRILVESSTESEWVARYLEELGHEVIVADPTYAPMYPHRVRRVKTDRRDARALAEACRTGTFRRAHRCSEAHRRVRAQLTVREALVRTRARYISIVRAIVRGEGERVRSGDADTFVERVRELELRAEVSEVIEPLLDLMEDLTERVKQADQELELIARGDEVLRRLRTVPGVGPVTAITFKAVVDRIERFHKAHHLESYLGLVPGERSSGESRYRGRLTKRGNNRARWLLVEAAWIVFRGKARGTQALSAWARRIAARRGKRVAVVALARKLAGILFAMWRDGADFDPQRSRAVPKVALQAA
jgi:transposase